MLPAVPSWLRTALLWIGMGVFVLALAYFVGPQVWGWAMGKALAAREEAFKAKADGLQKAIDEQTKIILSEKANVTQAKADAKQYKEEVSRLLHEREGLLRAVADAKARREQVHDVVAKVPDAQVLGRIRIGLRGLGLMPPGSGAGGG